MISRARSRLINNRGLTLVELMVATSLILIVIVSMGSVFINGQNSFYYLEGSSNNMQEARFALDQLSRDLRTAIQITNAGATSIEFTGDYNGDGTTETITYTKSGSNLTRTIGSASKEVASGVVNTDAQLVFSYYDQNGAAVIDGTTAKLIQIDLRVDRETNKSPNRSTQLVSRIQLRNLHERR